MQVIYLNVADNQPPEARQIKDDLQTYYDLIECNAIDIMRRKIGKRYFRIIYDDEGLLVENPKISAISNLGEVRLVASFMVIDILIDEAFKSFACPLG